MPMENEDMLYADINSASVKLDKIGTTTIIVANVFKAQRVLIPDFYSEVGCRYGSVVSNDKISFKLILLARFRSCENYMHAKVFIALGIFWYDVLLIYTTDRLGARGRGFDPQPGQIKTLQSVFSVSTQRT